MPKRLCTAAPLAPASLPPSASHCFEIADRLSFRFCRSAQAQPTTTYQVNVSRKKTRKWVEAKVQNYDGDDWGADEFDEESDQEPVPPPPINPSLRTFSGTDLLHSRHNTPSPASSLSALPSLRTQAQQSQQQPAAVPPPAGQPPRIGVSSPDVSDVSIRSASESIASGHAVSPQSVTASHGRDGDSNLSLAGIAQLPSHTQLQDQQQQGPGGYDVSRSSSFERSIKPTPTPTPPVGNRSLSPHISAPSAPPADQPPPIIYSPDNYSRLNDDNEHQPLAPAPVIPQPVEVGPDLPPNHCLARIGVTLGKETTVPFMLASRTIKQLVWILSLKLGLIADACPLAPSCQTLLACPPLALTYSLLRQAKTRQIFLR